MVLHCLTWVPYVLGQLYCHLTAPPPRNINIKHLPDDVIIQILSKLPVECVLKCRRVCKRWEELTSTPEFSDLHLINMDSVLFLQQAKGIGTLDYRLFLFVFYPRSRKGKNISKVRLHPDLHLNSYMPKLVGICNGLLLFMSKKNPSISLVYNPVLQELINFSNPSQEGCVCGIYFQPSTSEYNVLYVQSQGNHFLYYSRALIGGATWRQLSYLSCEPAYATTATTVNGSLHWLTENYVNAHCTEVIMVFNINSEEFSFMSHPGKEDCQLRESHRRMQLFEMKEHLSLSEVDVYNKCLNMWVLMDYTTCAWVRRYIISLDWSLKYYPFYQSSDFWGNYNIKPLMIQNNELLLAWSYRGIFWYHLKDNTIRKMQSAWMEKNGLEAIRYEIWDFRAAAYTKTLVSLRQRHPNL